MKTLSRSFRSPGSSRSPQARAARQAAKVLGLAAGVLLGQSCDVDLGARTPESTGSFGSIVFREACQRVSYTAELSGGRQLDVTGTSSSAMCRGSTPPSGADPTVQALFAQRDNIISGVDRGVPSEPDDLQSALDGYLRAVQPLQDDGTMVTLVTRTADVLKTMAADEGVVRGLGRLGHIGGIRPPGTAGGMIRAVAGADWLDKFIGASLTLLDTGGVAAGELQAVLRASAFELRHLERSSEEATSPERTPYLLRKLLITTHPELLTTHTLPIALRDPRGLPLLTDIAAPYTLDMATGLALADPAGYFLDSAGARIPYVSPLPEPGVAPTGMRDSRGRVLRMDGKPLYQYVELDGSLLLAGLAEARVLVDDTPGAVGGPARNMLFGMLQGASLLAGSRSMLSKVREGETITYQGFDPKDSVLLDLVHGAAQLLRFQPATAGVDIADSLRGLRTLLAEPANEGPLARVTLALLTAADEAKKPIYDTAKIPENSTLFDDLVPIIQRLLAVDDGALAEDLVTAMGDEHAKNLGPIMAQLADERGYFFMRQPNAMDGLTNLPVSCAVMPMEDVNGLKPCGVIGEFGDQPDHSAADSDVAIDWRGKKTNDPQNNRSVLQRLLHMVADSNGTRPFCNGRSASVFGGLVRFDSECDMFQLDNVGRFFMLTMASPALRDRTDTYAKQSASFREAIKNGRLCRGATPDPSGKCAGLLTTIDDGINGDKVLEGMMGIVGFGRYPDSQPGARAIFADVADPPPPAMPWTGAIRRTQDLVFNHVPMGGSYIVDPADPDNRKFKDGAGVDRLFIDEHNGVLFALEKVHGPATLPDGSINKYPNDTFYDAMRPLVDAFAKHAECLARDGSGICTKGQNATQILVDAMTVLHRHYPSARSQYLGRSFAQSYGALVQPDGVVSYETLLVKIFGGDLLTSTADLTPTLLALTVDGQVGSRRVLPLLIKLGRFLFDPSAGPPVMYRDGTQQALRNDGKPAGPATIYYILADALKKKRQIFAKPENQAIKASWDQARSDTVDALMTIATGTNGSGKRLYGFYDRRLRPMGSILLDFLIGRVVAHGSDLPGWTSKLISDTTDAVSGPLAPALIDLAVKLNENQYARNSTYGLLRGLLDTDNIANRDALAVTALDSVQLLLDEPDLLPIGRGIASALVPETGPALTGITLMRRGRELEQRSDLVPQPKQTLVRLLQKLYAPDASGVYPMFKLSDAIGEVNRAHSSTKLATGDFTAEDYRAVLKTTGDFLVEQQRGLLRFLNIVQSRCLEGSTSPGCPATK